MTSRGEIYPELSTASIFRLSTFGQFGPFAITRSSSLEVLSKFSRSSLEVLSKFSTTSSDKSSLGLRVLVCPKYLNLLKEKITISMRLQDPHRQSSRSPFRHISRFHILTFLTSSLLLGLYFIYHHYDNLRFLYITRILSTRVANCHAYLPDFATNITHPRTSDPIPNIVHYVWLIGTRPNFELDFKTFLSIYSASIYLSPTTIYIHTDATPVQFAAASNSTHSPTRWALRITNLTYHYVTPPSHTTTCTRIYKPQHLSDFVRVDMLFQYGGIYLDTDVITLKSLTSLRESGFTSVFGLEEPERVNNGIMLAKPESAVMAIMRREQHRVFDNRWTTHSVDLLTKVTARLGRLEGEVLIVGERVFSPSSFRKEDIDWLFKPHDDVWGPAELEASKPLRLRKGRKDGKGQMLTPLPKVLKGYEDALEYWESREEDMMDEPKWEKDYSGSYLIHAFDGKPPRYWPEHVDLEYVFARRSNYARAVYPAVRRAIEVGIIDRER